LPVRSDDFLSQQAFLSHLSQPNRYDLNFLRTYMQDPKSGNHPILGLDRCVYDGSLDGNDLISLCRPMNTDILSRVIRNKLVPSIHNLLGAKFKDSISCAPESSITQYSDGLINSAINVLGTVVSSLLPVLAIVVLYYVKDMLARLGCIAAFTGLFSLALGLMTQGSRVEIFAATST
jgi:hypothetical protein